MRRAMTDAFFKTLDSRRSGWQQQLSEMSEELAALHRSNEKQQQFLKELEEKKKELKKQKKSGQQRSSLQDVVVSIAGNNFDRDLDFPALSQ